MIEKCVEVLGDNCVRKQAENRRERAVGRGILVKSMLFKKVIYAKYLIVLEFMRWEDSRS